MTITNLIALATELPDHDLLARIAALAAQERWVTVELLAHLAALDSRPSLYASEGYGSLFTYCTHVLHLSEDAACTRIRVARACRRFPVILDLLASGALSLTSMRLLAEHLTPENHGAVLERASGRSCRDVEALVTELAPRPDAPSSVRRLPAPRASAGQATTLPTATPESVPSSPEPVAPSPAPAVLLPPPRRPIIETTSPERYRIQFTVGKETHDKLRRRQELLRREIRDADPGAIFDRAVTLLLDQVQRKNRGAASKPRPSTSIRPETDKPDGGANESRDIPRNIKRAVDKRDGGQCGFLGPGGHRCPERTFLEYHHIVPYGPGRPHDGRQHRLALSPAQSVRSGARLRSPRAIGQERNRHTRFHP